MPKLYRIIDSNHISHYLYGTCHVGGKIISTLAPEVVEAMNAAESIAIESDLESLDAYRSSLENTINNYKKKHDLHRMVWLFRWKYPDSYEKLIDLFIDALKKNAWYFRVLPQFVLASLAEQELYTRPLVLSVFLIKALLLYPKGNQPVDKSIFAFAKRNEKQVFFLESSDFANEKLIGGDLSTEQQVEYCKQSIDTFEPNENIVQSLITAYLNNDLDVEWIDRDNPTEEQAKYDKGFWDDRDENFTNNLFASIEKNEGESVFAAVGAGHLKGMVKSLRAKGHKVEEVSLSQGSVYLDNHGCLHDKSEKPWYSRLFDWIRSFFTTAKRDKENLESAKKMNSNSVGSYSTLMITFSKSQLPTSEVHARHESNVELLSTESFCLNQTDFSVSRDERMEVALPDLKGRAKITARTCWA